MTNDSSLYERIEVYLRGGWGRAQCSSERTDCEWYAVVSAAQRERQVAAALAERGFTIFLPMKTEWAGSPKARHMSPLMPGYVFTLCGAGRPPGVFQRAARGW